MEWQQVAAEIVTEIAGADIADQVMILEPGEIGLTLPAGIGGLHSPTAYELSGCDPGGFCCVVQGDRFGSDQERIGAVLHELAHRIDGGPVEIDTEPPTELERCEAALLMQLILAARSGHIRRTRRPPWYQHEQRFVVAATVLAYRAGQLLESIRPRHLKFSEPYTGVPDASWFEVLGETVTRAGSVGEIVAGEWPAAFVRAWRSVSGDNDNQLQARKATA